MLPVFVEGTSKTEYPAHGSKRIIAKQVHFVEIKVDGTAVNASYAPYLDYRAATSDELSRKSCAAAAVA